MKRLLVLTAVAILSATAIGCNCCNPFTRGPACPTCGQAGVSAYGADGYTAPPAMPPGTYAVPGPA